MDQKFDRHSSWVRNKTTGSEFHYSLIPPDFSPYDCWYENPQYGIKVGFHIRSIYEQKELYKNGRTVRGPVCTGAILIEGELRRLLVKATEARISDSQIDGLVRDCHELIIERIKGQPEFDQFGITPHIYEAELRRFGVLANKMEVSPEAVEELDAKLVV